MLAECFDLLLFSLLAESVHPRNMSVTEKKTFVYRELRKDIDITDAHTKVQKILELAITKDRDIEFETEVNFKVQHNMVLNWIFRHGDNSKAWAEGLTDLINVLVLCSLNRFADSDAARGTGDPKPDS